jgi:hypothetical protein
MSRNEKLLLRDRALRNRARAVLDEQVGRVKADLEARGIGARAADTVAEEASLMADAGASLARESKGAIAGTIGALLIWRLRAPILRQAKEWVARFSDHDDRAENQDGDMDSE